MSDNTLSLRESLLKLAGFSDLESRIFQLKDLIESPPDELTQKTQLLGTLQKKFEQKKQNFQELESKNNELGRLFQEDQEKIKIKETRIFEIKTTKEYQAASKEISDGKRTNIEREKQRLLLMEEIEKLKQELAPLEAELTELSSGVKNMSSRLEEERVSHRKELEEAENTKKQLLNAVERPLIERYERVLSRRRPAVAPVRAGTCEECNVHLPPQMYIELQKCLEIINCPSCMRILYVPLE
ncbi:MAG: hypothetical protein HQM15_02990 [Deltaproteobacteria bacterium]|nr:hypothetical protein [Deltaproteobacteria bacterium]